jgi:hypothetical protein
MATVGETNMSNPLDYWNCFGSDYAAARAKFMEAANQAGAVLEQHIHPTERGPGGDALTIDVARLGNPHASVQLLAISGTHGLEGAAGSAVQVGWLASGGAAELPADVSVVLVHGLNPYGFAYASRTTENNVDLNRNFVDHLGIYPENHGYAELHGWMIPESWTESALVAAERATTEFREKNGADALYDTTARGQYTHPQGLMFGGHGREWSNIVLERIVADHLSHARRVGFIDWHTGIGDYGEPFFLCFNEEGGDLEREAVKWWGEDRIRGQRPHGLARPNYKGLVFHGVQQFLGGRPMAGAVIEFGTRGMNMRGASRLDQWLRFRAPSLPDAERDAMLRADIVDAFVPTSSIWRHSILQHGVQITRQAVAGLAAWR